MSSFSNSSRSVSISPIARVRSSADKISGADKSKIESAVNEVKEAIKGGEASAIKSASEKLNEAWQAVSSELYKAAADFSIDLPSSWFIGDILDDIEAGRRAGCRTVLIDNGNETEWEFSRERIPTRFILG